MHGRIDKLRTSRIKRRKVIKDEMLCEDESNIRTQSGDDDIVSFNLRQKLFAQRKPVWEALFKKYESKTEEVSSEDCISLVGESWKSKERECKSARPSLKLKNWHEEFIPSCTSSKDYSEQPAEVDEAAEKSEDVGTVENSVINESRARKSNSIRHLSSRASNIGKKDKKNSVSKDISQNIYQLRSRKKSNGNFEKTADAAPGIISNGIKKHQERTFENRTYEKTNNVEKLCQHESSRVHGFKNACNKHDNKTCFDTEVNFEKQAPVKMDLINSAILSKHVLEEKKKNYGNGDLKFLNVKNLGNTSQNSPNKKLGIARKVYKKNCKTKQETYENIAHDSQHSFLSFSIDLVDTDDERNDDFSLPLKKNFEKQGQKNVQNSKSIVVPEETEREMLKWRTEFSNFIKYQWKDFQKNPGSMLFPLPKLKSSNLDEKLSWESIMNSN
ncbi:Protein of unknown function [Gryllus bimaculatus]|nr:Protein of unknown function [Gryllus bimaculatus]